MRGFVSSSHKQVIRKEQGGFLPDEAPVLYQKWKSLLFLHWQLKPEVLAELLPAPLKPDLFDGKAWIGVVPFLMQNVRPRGLPSLPWISNFLELNLRTYVLGPDGLPGVWFFSLDCNRWPAVFLARNLFCLNYQWASMQAKQQKENISYSCRRFGWAEEAGFRWDQPRAAAPTMPGTLEYFLIERYVLFSTNRKGELYHGRVFHKPYEIAPVSPQNWSSLPMEWNGLPAMKEAPCHCVASNGVSVEIFPLKKVAW